MYKKIFVICLMFCCLLFIQETYALKIMEQITGDLEYKNTIDIGLTAPGEQMLISFFQGVHGTYTEIKLSEESKEIGFLENTKRTKESIFTTMKINDRIKGTKNINLILIGKNQERKITLRTTITNEVVYAYLLEYEKTTKIEERKTIPIRIINKAASTKEIIIKSDFSKHWFLKETNMEKKMVLQPHSVTDVEYEFIPRIIGKTNQNIHILSDTKEQREIETKAITKEIEINVIKNLESIQHTKKHFFTLYGLNILPIHFFNNFLKYFSN